MAGQPNEQAREVLMMIVLYPGLRVGLGCKWSFSEEANPSSAPTPKLRVNPLPSGHKGLPVGYSQVDLSPVSLSLGGTE